MNRTQITALAAATLFGAASAHASFNGYAGFVRAVGGYTVVDVFAVTTSANHKLYNVYDSAISTSAAAGFHQAPGMASKTWRPDTLSFSSTRESIDSFMTVGASRYAGDPAIYAGSTTSGDPNFNGTSWNGSPASMAAGSVPALAGWYTNDPTSDTLFAEDLSLVAGERQGAAGGFGVWCAHLVLAGTANETITWSAVATTKNLSTGVAEQVGNSQTFAVPAPGAAVLLAGVGLCARRRRS
jgi:hypothetical protein